MVNKKSESYLRKVIRSVDLSSWTNRKPNLMQNKYKTTDSIIYIAKDYPAHKDLNRNKERTVRHMQEFSDYLVKPESRDTNNNEDIENLKFSLNN